MAEAREPRGPRPEITRELVVILALAGLFAAGCRVEFERLPCDIDVDCPDGELCYEDQRCIVPDVARQLGATVGTECVVSGGAIRGCDQTCRMGFCDGPPVFDGARDAVSDGPTELIVRWDYPMDETPAADLVYTLFMSAAPGGEDFSTPTQVATGGNELRVEGLTPETPYYFVVRVADEYGQVDDNTHEVRGVPGCTEYSTQVQPIFDARCVACHGEEMPARGLRLDSLAGLREGTATRQQVVPCRSEESWLVHRVLDPPALDDRGPHGGLEDWELALLRAWIDEGAEDTCPVDRAVCADEAAPTFVGLATATAPTPSTAELCWAEGEDDLTPAGALVYRVYEALASGAQDYDDFPAATARPGETCITLGGRIPGETYCWVVRARDGAGNEDGNVVERCLTVPPAACISFEEVLSPLFAARCIHCHGGPEPLARLSLESHDGVLVGGRSGPIVTACEPDGGPLLGKLGADPPTGLRMPGDGPPYLSEAQRAAVRQWISEGARRSCEDTDPC